MAGGQQSTMAGGEVEYLSLSSSTLGPNNQHEERIEIAEDDD